MRALLALVVLGVIVAWFALRPGPSETARSAPRQVTELLGGSADGFAQIKQSRALEFPADHGPHPQFRHEWWYWTGHLFAEDGRRFGVQLTFFRFALSPKAPERDSAWASNQVYMVHFALSDPATGKFFSAERMARGALDLAGARAQPFRVWVHDWYAGASDEAFFPQVLHAGMAEAAIHLNIEAGKPYILNGDRGYSRKGPALGNASLYLSWPRLPAHGTVTLGTEKLAVSGELWLDREWGSSALGPDIAGWDWFALQLGDGSELMYYRLRRTDGSSDPLSRGTRVRADGSVESLAAEAVRASPRRYWRSPATGVDYPVGWRLQVEPEGLDLRIEPLLDNQELDRSVRYWEGAVDVRDAAPGGTLRGRGFVELTGYGP